MNELGLNVNQVNPWFPVQQNAPYIRVQVPPEVAALLGDALSAAIRRSYISDEALLERVNALEPVLHGTAEFRQGTIIAAKLPDAGATMAGDFGEILIYAYQAASALPAVAFGPKKWRLKQDRTKPAPCSDVVQFILPEWPNPSAQDSVLCAEVKMKSTGGNSKPISDAIEDCQKDRTSRLSRTLQWFKERALAEPIGQVEIAHLDRFINATDHPPATRRFSAVAVVCAGLVDAELADAPPQASPDFTLVVVSVPNLHAVYNGAFAAARASTLNQQ